MQVQKLDTSLATIWVKTYDGFGYDDAGVGIALDSQANVIVTGSSDKSTGTQELFVVKYTNAGTKMHEFLAMSNATESEGLRVKIGLNDDIFIGGTYGTGSSRDVAVIVLDSALNKVGQKFFNGSYGLEDKFMDMAVTPDNIHLSVRSFNGSTDDNLVVTYSYRNFVYTPKADTVAHTNFVANQVLATFHKSALKMAAINNKNKLYGNLIDFVADSTCDKIGIVLGDPKRPFDARTLRTRKIVTQVESDTVSQSRLGTYIKMPMFYATLLVELPTTFDEATAAAAIASVPIDVFRCQLDNMYELDWVPNDTYYAANQSSLHTTTLFPNAHINCEPAWDRTKGQPFVRAGFYDSGTMMNHQDMTIANAIDYSASQYSVTDIVGHGAAVCSIIGANSNNSLGVTGIAGGDNGTPGVSLYNNKVGDGGLIPWHDMKQAFIDGASGTNVTGGQALHVINCSFGLHTSFDAELLDGVNYINHNGVAFVCSRGNKMVNDPWSVGGPNIPATLKPKITMNVGATGTDGQYHVRNVNGTKYTSMDSMNVDFVAPGAYDNVYACTTIQGSNPPWHTANVATADYTTFAGTSSSDKATQHYANWDAYKNDNIKRVIDAYFSKLDEHLKSNPVDVVSNQPGATVQVYKHKGSNIVVPEVVTKHSVIAKAPAPKDEPDIEFTERIPEEIRFLKRYLSLHNKKKTKEDLLRFINALHRAIVERKLRKTSPYAKQISYIQEKLVKRYNEMDKPQTMEVDEKVINEFKALIGTEKVMPSVLLMKRYITLNGKFDVKEKAKRLMEAMKKANDKGMVKKSDKYIAVLDRMYDTLSSYVKSKSMKFLNITEPELNGLNGILSEYDGNDVDGFSEEFNGLAGTDETAEAKVIKMRPSRIVNSMDFDRLQFKTLGFTGKYLNLIGDPCKGFSTMVYGRPKMGKSYLCMDFAGYLARNFGRVLYIAREEGLDFTLQKKLRETIAKHANLDFYDNVDEDFTPYDYIFLDSINKLGLSTQDLDTLKHNYPDKSFIYVFQTNKDGNFKGSNEFQHEVDVVIELPEQGKAVQHGRFNPGGEMRIFDVENYQAAA